MDQRKTIKWVSGCAGALALTMVFGAGPAVSGPPGVNLLDCTEISDISTSDACLIALKDLCDATAGASAGDVSEGFKNLNDRYTLTKKTVGAAVKYDQGKDGEVESKLVKYSNKLNGLACYPVENKPKVQCELPDILNTKLNAAATACGATLP